MLKLITIRQLLLRISSVETIKMSADEVNCGVLYLTDKSNMSGLSGHFPDTILLKPGRQIIGRSNKADIKLSAEKEGKFIISRSHAAIIVQGESCSTEIEDLGALNGIFVNEVRVKCAYLKDGDVLQFGGMSEVPVGKRLTGGDAAVRYIYHASKSISISGTKRGPDSNGSKEKRVKLSVPSETSNLHVGVNGDNASHDNASFANHCKENTASRNSVDKSLATPIFSHSKANNNINANKIPTAPGNSVNVNTIKSNNNGSNNTVTLRIPANSFVLSPQATQELQQLRETQARHTVLLEQLLPPNKNNKDTSASNDSILMFLQELKTQFNDQLKEIKQVQSRHETLLSHLNNDKHDNKDVSTAVNHLMTLVTQLEHQQRQLQHSSSHFNNKNNTNNIDHDSNQDKDGDKLRHTLMTQMKCVLCREVGVELCVLRCSHSVCALCLAAYLCPDEPALKQFVTQPVTHTSHDTAGIEHHVLRLACPACDIPLLPPLPRNTSWKVPVAFRSASLDEVVFSMCQDQAHCELLTRYETRRATLHYLFYPRGSDDTAMVSQDTRDALASYMPLPEMLDTVSHIQEEHSQRQLQHQLQFESGGRDEEKHGFEGVSRYGNIDHDAAEHDDTDVNSNIVLCDYCGETGHSVSECPHNNNKYYNNEEEVEEEENENELDHNGNYQDEDEEQDM